MELLFSGKDKNQKAKLSSICMIINYVVVISIQDDQTCTQTQYLHIWSSENWVRTWIQSSKTIKISGKPRESGGEKLIVFLPFSSFFSSINSQDRLADLKIIDQMLRTYDRRATPTNKIGEPTRVQCELFIRSFGSISEKTMVNWPIKIAL